MPSVTRVLKPCATRGCPTLTPTRHCSLHGQALARRDNQRRNSRPLTSFYQSAEWKRTRKRVLDRDGGVCVDCGNPATIGDHDPPLVEQLEAGLDGHDDDLIFSRCHSCAGRRDGKRSHGRSLKAA